MATKTRSSKTSMNSKNKTRAPSSGDKSSHLSALMMLSQQLLSAGRFNNGLPSFMTKSVDSEQIWQQLELRNDHKLALTACTKEIVNIQRRKSPKKKTKKVIDHKDNDSHVTSDNDTDDSNNSESDVDGVLDSIKKRLTANEEDEDNFGGFDESSEEDGDELDFDFEVDKELSKGLSDEESDRDSEGKPSMSKNKSKKKLKRTTVVDDKFFKMADMEEFLDAEDLKEEKRLKRKKTGHEDQESSDEDEEEEDDIDMFAADSEDDDAAAEAKYSDFFDPVDGDDNDKENELEDQGEDGGEGESEDEKTVKPKKKSITKKKKRKMESDEDDDQIDDDGDEDKEDDGEEEDDHGDEEDIEMDDSDEEDDAQMVVSNDDDDVESGNKENVNGKFKKNVSFSKDLFQSDEEEDNANNEGNMGTKKQEQKSSFELKQEKLQAKAKEMEELSLKETPWELTGETSSTKRPENSLLETVLDFQHTTRAAPVITDDTTKTLEDFIKQRIKDKTFDDVERKEKPKEDVFEFKKRIVLDQEKSKLSLGELYEQEFLKQQQQDVDEVKADPECEKIEDEMKKLFFQLDALSNFRYTPMKPGSEVKVIVNTPAITMEEVAPVSATDADLLAPEEVHEKRKGDLKADDERDDTDKKRARRQKKSEKRERKKAKESREKLVEKLKPGLGNKYSKEKALKQLEEISKSSKNVTMIKGDNKKLASSTAFFSQLQDEVTTNVKAKKGAIEKKKKKLDPSKLML